MHLLGLEVLDEILDGLAMYRAVVALPSGVDSWPFGWREQCHDRGELNCCLGII